MDFTASEDTPRDSSPVGMGGIEDDSTVDLEASDRELTTFENTPGEDSTQVEMRGIEHDRVVDLEHADTDLTMSTDRPRADSLAVQIRGIKHDSAVDPDGDLTMFEDTPRDSSLVEVRGKMACPPYDQVELDSPPSLAKLASIPIWSPELDEEYLMEEKRCLANWNDFRFKKPHTAYEIDCVQRALEMTRLDYYFLGFNGMYPHERSEYSHESYGSQHRRLQHRLCRTWSSMNPTGTVPFLFRLPSWGFSFEERYWRLVRWSFHKRLNAYYEVLAAMVVEKNEKGLYAFPLKECRDKVVEMFRSMDAKAQSELAQFLGIPLT